MQNSRRGQARPPRALAAAAACALIALSPAAPRAEDILVSVDASVPAGAMPSWFEPSMFAQWNPPVFVEEFLSESGSTAGMIRLGVETELANSTGLDEFIFYLDVANTNAKVRAVADAGAEVLLVIAKMPLWLSSYTGSPDDRVCSDWYTYQTYPPAADKWDEWEEVVFELVKHYNVDEGYGNIRYELWNEPDIGCHYNGTQAEYLEMWRRMVAGAERADPAVRLGGTSSNGGPWGTMDGESVPLLQAFLETSAAEGLDVDVVTFHTFGYPPSLLKYPLALIDSWLETYGFPDAEVIMSEYNPRDAILSEPSWPSPPTPTGRQVDSEMGAAYFLSAMAHLAAARHNGYQCMAHLTNFDYTEEWPNGPWGARTNWSRNGIRKAVYHAHGLPGRMVRSLVESRVAESDSTDEYFPHFGALAGADATRLTLLAWNYVAVPIMQAIYILPELGYGSDDMDRWGGTEAVRDYYEDRLAVTDLTSDPTEQADLESTKRAYLRQQELVTETHHVELDVTGLPSIGGYRLTRFLIDETHSNAYHHYLEGGPAAAIDNQGLEVIDSRRIAALAEIGSIDLKPYSVTLLEIEAASVGEVERLVWTSHRDLLWDAAPGASEYDVVRGDLADLRSGGYAGAGGWRCHVTGTTAIEPDAPARGNAWYYRVRGRDAAEVGTWGSPLADTEITVCP